MRLTPRLVACTRRLTLRGVRSLRSNRVIGAAEARKVVIVQGDRGAAHVLLEVGRRPGARYQQDVLVGVQEPGKGDLDGRRVMLGGNRSNRRVRGERPGSTAERRADGKERHV